MSFVHLHVHSAYSLLDGAIKINDLVTTAKAMGMPAVALTDHGQMFGALNFYNKAKATGIKPIVGVETYVSPDRFGREKHDPRHHLVLLAMDLGGYHNLLELITLANTEGFYYKPRVDHGLLKKHNKGLIALTACLQGEIPRAVFDGKAALLESLGRYQDIFGDRLYLEVQENQIPEQAIVNQALLDLGRERGVPLVATNDCHYLKKEDYKAHDILLCIQTNSKVTDSNRMRMPFNTYWLRSPEEMRELFAWCPEACDNTLKVAGLCNLELPKKEYRFPKVRTLGEKGPKETLIENAEKGLEAYFLKKSGLGDPLSEEGKANYRERLESELGVINDVGFAGYFLIVADFIRWARDHGIPVGPGRGSAAGSLVAFSLGITNVDPIRFGLLFERFLNHQRVSMPDIDVDFCAEGRAEVLDYVIDAYGGPEHVAQILTLGQLKARGVIRDVGRALDVPLAEVDTLAKLVPMTLNITLDQALAEEPRLKELYSKKPQVRELIDYARILEGLPRHASVHASGVVIGDRPLKEYLPLFQGTRKQEKADSRGLTVTQFEGSGVEALGLIKFDFLGLKTLTLIKHCLRLLAERGVEVDIDAIDLADGKTFEFLRKGNLNGVFQMEQEGIRQYLRNIRPERIDDIMSLLALYRPGPLKSGQADQYVAIRRGQKKPKYVHDSLIPVLEDTQGVILYQEQVLRIAQVLADFSLAEADLLRRAIGKKHQDEMDRVRPDFIERCVRKGLVGKKVATAIFEQLEKFAEYGFNKSHSAAYALVSYQTAWLKCRYPVEFMAALMTSEMADKEKIAGLIDECRADGIGVLPPDVNTSGYKFTVHDGRILFGLGAIKGVGEGAIDAIIAARKEKRFSDFFDFCDRVMDKKANRKVLEALILSGALDASGGASRAVMLASLETAIERKRDSQRSMGLPLNPLFGNPGGPPNELNWSEAEPLPENQRLAFEKEYLGFYVTGHPLGKFAPLFKAMGLDSIPRLQARKSPGKVRLLGSISQVKVRIDKNNKQYAFATMEDIFGKCEVVLWSRAYALHRDLLEPDRVLVAEGSSEPPPEDSPYGSKVIIESLWDLEDKLADKVRSVTFTVPAGKVKAFSDFLARRKAAEREGGEAAAVGFGANGGAWEGTGQGTGYGTGQGMGYGAALGPAFGPAYGANGYSNGYRNKCPFFLRIEDNDGHAIYMLQEPPILTVGLVREASGILGDASLISCSFTPSPMERQLGQPLG
ncbi:MAG: DNA polymerase III subunit alpha [Deltaproteobacteria bacterium]|jgi:DNA polymerase-3 subunit alpha|nr:DNA polymerase III subunit alpha [Deltaproteobacteria bacterium]